MAGCSEPKVEQPTKAPTTPVSGKVTFRGKPLANADVTFHAADGLTTARGRTDSAGLYFLSTYAEKDGAAAGLYKVTVVHNPNAPAAAAPDGVIAPIPPEGESFKGQPPPLKSDVPAKYGNSKLTDLTAEVKAGSPNTISFDLK